MGGLVRTNRGDAAVSRFRIPDANLREQFHGSAVAPPLVVTDEQLDPFVLAIRDAVELAHSPGAFWSEASEAPGTGATRVLRLSFQL
jgi:hypothetical protein